MKKTGRLRKFLKARSRKDVQPRGTQKPKHKMVKSPRDSA